MGVHTFSIDDEIAQKFKEQTPSQETSNVVEQMMRDYLDETPDQDIQLDFNNLGLSQSQEELVQLFAEKNVKKKTTNAVFDLAKKNGIYGRSHHFGEAMESISNNKDIPYAVRNEKLISEAVECSCGARMQINVVIDNDCRCFQCDTKIVRL